MEIKIAQIPENECRIVISPIELNEAYRKEWNVTMDDFVVLSKNGQLINSSIYRIGGASNLRPGTPPTKNYFILLKYVESTYEMEFLRRCYPQKKEKELELQRKHLDGRFCIIDKNGTEKKVFESFKSPYLIKDSCIYTLDSNYYNIETGEFYCRAFRSMETSECLLLENPYDEDLSKRGVMVINKKNGTWQIMK